MLTYIFISLLMVTITSLLAGTALHTVYFFQLQRIQITLPEWLDVIKTTQHVLTFV